MAKTKPEPNPTTSDVPTAGTRPLIGHGPPFPIGSRANQEGVWNTLKRYRRQLDKMEPKFRQFIVLSLHADWQEETNETISQNGATVVGDAAADAPL